MDEIVHIEDLRKHLELAKDRLSQEKSDILELHDLPDDFKREEYAFAYVRAERLGLRAINRRLTDLAWLPMQLDPRTEVLSESRVSMKRWLTSPLAMKPSAEQFGNDFIHSLTRCAVLHGGQTPAFFKLSKRISNLFRELSCLIGLIYYCTWLAENGIEGITLSDPDNLGHTAEEIAALIQSPEIYRHIRAREQNDEKKKISPSKEEKGRSVKTRKPRPVLRVIENENFLDRFSPDPLPV
ncbi:MAG: hypothetical protein M3N08_06050 [Pseudomonadota bacterium]|nr:hypothetical protein [Pseudomonadota bacterium]